MKGVWLFFVFSCMFLFLQAGTYPVLYYDKYVENRNKENHING